jgi:ribonuclease T1
LIFQGKPVFFTVASSTGTALLQSWRQRAAAVLAVTSLVLTAAFATRALAKTPDVPAAFASVPLATLPAQAQTTYQLILNGGPFPYSKDGVVFGNRERQLPPKARGYYKEYTVKTPGARNRGARRIVCGGKPPTQPEACFYSDDHYASFRLIVK